MASSPQHFPVTPVPGLPVLAGLLCGHTNCGALFSDLDDFNSHAEQSHAGAILANTCAIQELENSSGQVELVLVVDESEDDG
jgi:carbonic anhydrase